LLFIITNIQVKIGDIPLQLDCLLGSGFVNDSLLGTTKGFTPDYFGTPPHQLILTHLPHDPSHQCLEHPLSIEELQFILPVPMTTLRQGIIPLTWCEEIVLTSESRYPVVSVDVEVSNTQSTMVATLIPASETDCHGDCLDQSVQIKKVEKRWNFKVAISFKGKYNLKIFIKPPDGSPDSLCLSYIIHSEADSELKLGYPKLHEAALDTYELNLIHWNSPQSYMCQNLSGLLNLVFEANSNAKFDHFILPGRVAAPDTFTAKNAERYNSILFTNTGTDISLHQLQAVFPTSGWWTLEVSGALPIKNNTFNVRYTPLLTYFVYVTVGLPRNSYPHVLAPHISFSSTRPINATGDELFTIQFASVKFLNFRHYLTFEQVNSSSMEGFSKIVFEGKVENKECFVYSLKIIFPRAGAWFIHVLGREKGEYEDLPYLNLFKINAEVKGSMANTSFINYNHSVGESFGISLYNNGLLTFLDNGQPLCYSFEALPHVNFFHDIKRNTNDMSTHDFCTYLSPEPITYTAMQIYTMHTVFPENGAWLVQLFGAKEGTTNFSLVFTLNVNVSCPSPQLCYPKFNQAFNRLKMGIDAENALIKRECDDGEFMLPFKAPDGTHFTWSVELVSAGEKINSNAFVHHGRGAQCFHAIFPKPGEWLVRLFAKEASDYSANFHSVLEVCLNSLSCRGGVSFPQVFEAFYSIFDLRFDMKHLPLVSEVGLLPAKVLIPFKSVNPDILFWHDIDVSTADEDGGSNEVLNLDDQCKMISDPASDQHRLILEINAKGKWTVSLYAKRSVAVDKSWTAIMKFVVTAV
jgi:hypothetical protein